MSNPSLKRVDQGFDAVMTSASCNSQFLASFRIWNRRYVWVLQTC